MQAQSSDTPETATALTLAASGPSVWALTEAAETFWQFRLNDTAPWLGEVSGEIGGSSEWRALFPTETDRLDETIGESGPVWLRLPMRIPSERRGQLFAIDIEVAGAIEVYLNGRLVGLAGEIDDRGPAGKRGTIRQGGSLQLFELGLAERQDLEIRYSPRPLAPMRWGSPYLGFELTIGELSAMRERTDRLRRIISSLQMGFAGAYGAQAFLHLALFFFYRRESSHWYFAVLALSVALLVYLQFEAPMATEPALESKISFWWQISLVLAFLALLRFSYSLSVRCGPLLFWVITFIGFSLIAVRILRPEVNVFTDYWWFPILAMGASLRAILLAMAEQRRGAPILATGLVIFTLAVAFQMVVTFGIVELPFGEISPIPYLGLLGLTLSMSVYLAKSFADTNHDLEARLVEVEELSQRTLEQELEAKELELETRLLEVDNRRKTEELQSAREFLLSLLPNGVPDCPGYQIAAEMRTALEVGGDYYDWRVIDGAQFVAIGDATGHDVRAGAMVSIVKGLFTSWNGKGDPGEFLGHANTTLKAMKLRSVLMSFMLLRIDDGKIIISSAGMPPALIYRHAEARVEELTIEGMPLGALHRGPYPSQAITMAPGDCLLLTSDGLPELQTPESEEQEGNEGMLGYRRVREALAVAGKCRTARQTVEQMLTLVDDWCQGEPPSDDVIVLAVRRDAGLVD